MKSLVIGMGIGQLYKTVLEKLGYEVVTVDADSTKGADYTDIRKAINGQWFDTAHICTPNYTHLSIAETIAPYARIVFIEKPGVKTSEEWSNLVRLRPYTKFMMVKNNMWRDNIKEITNSASVAKCVEIDWMRKNCVPSPGSWFTTRSLAFGGVSRDLMPHLLSLYIAINPNWRSENISSTSTLQNWTLETVDSTEYGQINPTGTYDVDDSCKINFGTKWHCRADWRTLKEDRSAITVIHQDNTKEIFELGWCPEQAYLNMIKDAVDNVNNSNFWKQQLEQDLWIHSKIENL